MELDSKEKEELPPPTYTETFSIPSSPSTSSSPHLSPSSHAINLPPVGYNTNNNNNNNNNAAIDEHFKYLLQSQPLQKELNEKRIKQEVIESLPTTTTTTTTTTQQEQQQQLPSSSKNTLKLQDFWYPIVNYFLHDHDYVKPANIASMIFLLLLLPKLFFTWLFMQIATIARLTPGGTPHSSQVPYWLLVNIYNEQVEINHILTLSNKMSSCAEHYLTQNESDTTTTTTTTTTSTTTKKSPTARISESGSQSLALIEKESPCDRCCRSSKRTSQIQKQQINTTARQVNNEVQQIQLPQQTLEHFLRDFYTLSDQSINHDTVFQPFEHLAIDIPHNHISDQYHQSSSLMNQEPHLKPPKKQIETKDGKFDEIYTPISRSLPYRTINGDLALSEPILPQHVLEMWKIDERRYYTWFIIVFEVLLAVICFWSERLESKSVFKLSLLISILPTMILLAQYFTRCHQVHHAFRLTIDMIIAFPIAMFCILHLSLMILSILDSSMFFSAGAVILCILRLNIEKPRRHQDYEHHILVVQNYLNKQQQQQQQQYEQHLNTKND